MKSCIVIYNPNSGHILKKKDIPKYKKIIESYNYKVSFLATKYKGNAREIVSHTDYVDLVVSMGGDGTFDEVVCGNLERKERLLIAHIPIGTTNDIGVMFGYGNNIEKNIKACLDGTIKEIDIPIINERPFVYVAGFGKFLDIPYKTSREDKKKLGYFAYITNAIKDFFKDIKMYDITYKVDNKINHVKTSMILICSATRVAGFDSFFKDVKLDDDKFEVYIMTASKRLDLLGALGLSVTGNPEKVNNVIAFRTNNIKISFKNMSHDAWDIDGEELKIRKKEYEIHNEYGIKILIPKKNINKLFINK